MEDKVKSRSVELHQLKRYLRHLSTILNWLKSGTYSCSINQSKYVFYLSRALANYLDENKLYGLYLRGKVGCSDIGKALGVSDRQAFRYLENQRKAFMCFIGEKEAELFEKYPYYDDFEVCV